MIDRCLLSEQMKLPNFVRVADISRSVIYVSPYVTVKRIDVGKLDKFMIW